MKAYSYAYALHGFKLGARGIKDSCIITMMSLASGYNWGGEGDQYNRVSSPYMDLHNMMAGGFTLYYEGLYLPGRTLPFCFLGFRYRRKGCHHYYSRNSTWSSTNNVALNAVANLAFVLALHGIHAVEYIVSNTVPNTEGGTRFTNSGNHDFPQLTSYGGYSNKLLRPNTRAWPV
ncbi:hypothetical protein NL676_038883 [Syzygium grande]|nr:hypothetical protein NL676_038883 [Syzygium grande]